MELLLKRVHRSDISTIGELYINGVFECFTLEDIERIVKIDGKTAIPKGKYNVSITMSNRFKKMLPLIENVPNFSGIRIHPGNKAEDTEGCILVGDSRGRDVIFQSKIAFNRLFKKMKLAEKITLIIE